MKAFLKQFIQQNVVTEFFVILGEAEFFEKEVGIKIGVDFAAEGAVAIVFEAAVTQGNVAPFVADSGGA